MSVHPRAFFVVALLLSQHCHGVRPWSEELTQPSIASGFAELVDRINASSGPSMSDKMAIDDNDDFDQKVAARLAEKREARWRMQSEEDALQNKDNSGLVPYASGTMVHLHPDRTHLPASFLVTRGFTRLNVALNKILESTSKQVSDAVMGLAGMQGDAVSIAMWGTASTASVPIMDCLGVVGVAAGVYGAASAFMEMVKTATNKETQGNWRLYVKSGLKLIVSTASATLGVLSIVGTAAGTPTGAMFGGVAGLIDFAWLPVEAALEEWASRGRENEVPGKGAADAASKKVALQIPDAAVSEMGTEDKFTSFFTKQIGGFQGQKPWTGFHQLFEQTSSLTAKNRDRPYEIGLPFQRDHFGFLETNISAH